MKVIGNLTKDAIIRAAVSEGFTVTQVLGSETTFESGGRCDGVDVVYDSNAQKVVIAYRDNSNSAYGTAIVGTVSDTSISFGTAVVFHTDITNYIRIEYDSNAQKVVIVYQDDNDNNKGTAIVGTVSGTSISFGSPAVFGTNIAHISIAYDANAQKNVISYQNGADLDHGYAIVGTVSGTSISFGSAVEYESSAILFTEITYDSTAQKVILAWRDSGDSNKGKAAVGTVSGTSISYGSIVTFASGGTDEVRLAYDPNQNKTGFFYKDIGNSYYGTSTVATVSGTSITFGTAQVFNSAEVREFAAIYDTLAQRIVLTYRDVGNGERGTILTASISGTSMTFGTAAVFSQDPRRIHSTYDSNQQRVVCAYDDEGQNIGRSIVIKTGYTSATGGTIADGSAVIVNANGTVSTVSETSNSETLGSDVTFNAASTANIASAFDSTNNKVVVAYRDNGNSGYGHARVGTVDSSDNSISWGTEVTFISSSSQYMSVCFDSTNEKIVIAFQDAGDSFKGKAIVGTVSGTDISFGSSVEFQSGETTWINAVYDTSTSKVVIVYRNSSGDGKAIVGTVSGTSISFGSAVSTGHGALQGSAVYHAAASRIVAAGKVNNSTASAVVGAVSGTSISFGTAIAYGTGSAQKNNNKIGYDSASEKVIVFYRDEGFSNYGRASVGTVDASDNSISFASGVTVTTDTVDQVGVQGFSSGGQIIFVYSDTSNTKGDLKVGTISGTTLSVGSELNVRDGGNTSYWALCEDTTNDRIIIAYDGASSNGISNVYNPAFSVTNLTTENFVGFMDGAALDGTNGEILSSCSIARNQTSLTPGQTYFVSPTDGALSLTAGSPSVTAGTAISSTELIVKG